MFAEEKIYQGQFRARASQAFVFLYNFSKPTQDIAPLSENQGRASATAELIHVSERKSVEVQ